MGICGGDGGGLDSVGGGLFFTALGINKARGGFYFFELWATKGQIYLL
jgi:hypothetical protein